MKAKETISRLYLSARRRLVLFLLRRLKYPPGTIIVEDDVERYVIDCRGSMRKLEHKERRRK